MKVTKAMVNRAENAHLRSETLSSLVKSHALNALYYKQRGQPNTAKKWITSSRVLKKVKSLENPRRKTIRRSPRSYNPYSFGLRGL